MALFFILDKILQDSGGWIILRIVELDEKGTHR